MNQCHPSDKSSDQKNISKAHIIDDPEAANIASTLREKFGIYKTDKLTGTSASDFQTAIEAQLGTVESKDEGYSPNEVHKQRDLSIKFHWGHNHDFGAFSLKGK